MSRAVNSCINHSFLHLYLQFYYVSVAVTLFSALSNQCCGMHCETLVKFSLVFLKITHFSKRNQVAHATHFSVIFGVFDVTVLCCRFFAVLLEDTPRSRYSIIIIIFYLS